MKNLFQNIFPVVIYLIFISPLLKRLLKSKKNHDSTLLQEVFIKKENTSLFFTVFFFESLN